MSLHDPLQTHCIARLDRDAAEHRSGHQNVHARRYLLLRTGSRAVEVVIIVKPDSRLQIWCEASAMPLVRALALGGTQRPGSETYARTNAAGQPLYGRHHALKTMDHLHRGDAYYFVPDSVHQVSVILDEIAAGPVA